MTAAHWAIEAACAVLLFVVARAGLRELAAWLDCSLAAAWDVFPDDDLGQPLLDCPCPAHVAIRASSSAVSVTGEQQ